MAAGAWLSPPDGSRRNQTIGSGREVIARKRVAFELVLDGACDEAAQAPVAHVHLDANGESFLHADRPLADNHAIILPK